MDVLKQVRNDFFGEDYKKYILISFQKYFEKTKNASILESEWFKRSVFKKRTRASLEENFLC